MIKLKSSVLLVALGCMGWDAQAAWVDWQARGYEVETFQIAGRRCRVVKPTNPAPGRPWVWHARFPDFRPELDQLLLERGFHLAWIDTGNMFGSLKALDHWDAFYDHVTEHFGLAPKVGLIAVSRGGLFAYRSAARHPDRIACIYADTPVCDLKSWPLGCGKGQHQQQAEKALLDAYELTLDEALAYTENPVDVLKPLADKSIPLLHIVSLDDGIVPPEENTFVLADRYRALGGKIDIIEVAHGFPKARGHHFKHPAIEQVADFITVSAKSATAPPSTSGTPVGASAP